MQRIQRKRGKGFKNETIIRQIKNNKFESLKLEQTKQQILHEKKTRKKKKGIQE